MYKKFNLIIILCFLMIGQIAAKDYHIQDFGAKKGKLSTVAIQKAIDTCHQNGGGRVVIPSGQFSTGTIFLKSHVNLHFESGAELTGSADVNDYTFGDTRHGMIYAEDAENITLSGRGIINGNCHTFHDYNKNHTYFEFNRDVIRQKDNYMKEGAFFSDGPVAKKERPSMTIQFFFCNNVKILDLIVKDTPSWAIRLGNCEDVEVRGISILNDLLVPNSDGIHTTISRNVRISNCHFVGGDDAIIVTGFPKVIDVNGQPKGDIGEYQFGNQTDYAENIVVNNCVLRSRSAGIRVGYGSHSMRNCTFSNIVIHGSNRGIGLFARDEGSIENIHFSNIVIESKLHNGQWWGNGEPIHISAINQNENRPLGQIKNIHFNHITATGEQGIVIYGANESRIQNVTLDNIDLTILDGKESATYGGNFDLRPTLTLDKRLFEHDIPALYCQKTDGLQISNFKLKWGENLEDYFTHSIECLDVTGLSIEQFRGKSLENQPVFSLTDTQVDFIQNCIIEADKDKAIIRKGKGSESGKVGNNQMKIK